MPKPRFILLIGTLLFSMFSFGQNLLISQYIETNSGTTPKGVEIYNGTGADIVFSSSNFIQIYQGTNGGTCTAISATKVTSGTLAAGEVWVIGTSDLVSYAIANGTNLSGTTTYSFAFNGDDALELYLGSSVQDVFGTCGSDPGSSWTGGGVSTANNNLQIKTGICAGNTTYWTDPSLRFDQIAAGTDMTGFGDAPVCSTPTLSVSPSTLTGYSYVVGSGPSTSQSFDLSGTNMNGSQVTITAPTNYEVSTDNSTFSTSVNVSYTAPTLTTTTIYVRLKAGLAVGTYNGELVTCSDNGDASDITVSNDGEVTAVPSTGCATDLFISEYIEGSSNNKYIEIYNGTGSAVSLGSYDLVIYSNGSTTPGSPISLSGTLNDDDVYIVENSSAALSVTADLSTGSLSFNGDDVVALRKSSVNIDVVGIIGSTAEPGADVTLVRKSSVTSPTTTFDTNEWDSYAQDEDSYMGSHTMVCSCAAPTTQASLITFPNIYSTQLNVSWTNGDGSKRIVIMNTSNSFTDPVDGIDPAANSVYAGSGEQVVYNGNGNAVTVSGLTASTTYWFRVYEANCTGSTVVFNVSTATDNPNSCSTNTTAPPAGPTTFEPGDMIIVGFDTNIGSSGYDMITVASFVDIGPGTSFILANMVYEYEDAANVSTGRWYRCSSDAGKSQSGYPEYLEITYNGTAALSAGTVLCITLNNIDDCLEEIKVNGVTSSDFSSNNSGQVNMSSSKPDAIFLMQGTFSGILTSGSSFNYRTFSGSVLGGIQTRGSFQPITVPGNNGGERVSRIHPDLECLKLNTGTYTGEFYMYYYDWELHVGSQHTLLNNIFDMPSTWDSGPGTTTANEVPTCGVTFTITSSSIPGSWTGESNEDWFNCANWNSFSVPDSLSDVTIMSNGPYNNCVVDVTTYSSTAARYGNVAKCNNLNLEGTTADNVKLTIQGDPANKLKVFGDLTIDGNGRLDMTDGNNLTADGTLEIKGDWNNMVGPGSFEEGNSSVFFNGTSQQSMSCNGSDEVFYDFTINNTSGVLLNDNIDISGDLDMTDGVITTGTNRVKITDVDPLSIENYSQTSFINGNLRRNFTTNTSTYPFPIGNGTATTSYKRMDFINNNLNLSTGQDYLDVYVNTITETGLNDDPELVATEDGTPIVDLLESAVWTITPSGTISSGSWGAKLYVQNVANLSSTDDNMFSILKRATGSTDYGDWDSFDATTDIPAANSAGRIYNSGNGYAQKTGFSNFSELAIGKGLSELPIELLSFSGKYHNGQVDLNWITASEYNNDFFTIERSSDAYIFYNILEKDAAGNSTAPLTYFAIDKNPLDGISYYRLKQTDYNGKFSYSNVISVKSVEKPNNFDYFDNNGMIIINTNDDFCMIKVTDMQGGIYYNNIIQGPVSNYKLYLNKSKIPSGVYVFTLITSDKIISKKHFINR